MTSIGVMMPAYNAERYIGAALESLLRQREDAHLRIVVVDDGSSDQTATIVRSVAKEAPEVTLVEIPHGGIAAARNAALDNLPQTHFVTWLDADDLAPPRRFARDLAFFEAEPGLDAVYGYIRMFRAVGPDPLVPDLTSPYLDFRGIQLGAGLWRSDLLSAVGRFNPNLDQGEDTDLLFRFFQARPNIKLLDDVSLFYRRHDANITNDRSAGSRFFIKALREHISRQRNGGVGVPAGFFDYRDYRDWEGWR
jgi:glycosyltransferase involved in cell wall biosynthesis